MLRPEQVRLVPVESGVAASDAATAIAHGEVTGNGFGGSVCVTTIRIGGGTGKQGSHATFDVRGSSVDLLPVGTIVRITVVGEPHIFDTDPAGV
jgi:hypothetical protein